MARRAERDARSVVRAVARAHRADVRRRDVGPGHRPGDHPRHRAPADPEGGGEQRRARPDSGGQALREPHLLPLGQRGDAQPADWQTDRVRSGGDRGARRSGAAARHRQDAHSARDPEEAERARQARAEDDGSAHDLRRGDPRRSRWPAAAHADRGARAPSRRRRHRLSRSRGAPCRISSARSSRSPTSTRR